MLNLSLAKTVSTSFSVVGVVPPIIRVTSSNGITTILHNIPVSIENSSCTVISETEMKCVGNYVTVVIKE